MFMFIFILLFMCFIKKKSYLIYSYLFYIFKLCIKIKKVGWHLSFNFIFNFNFYEIKFAFIKLFRKIKKILCRPIMNVQILFEV